MMYLDVFPGVAVPVKPAPVSKRKVFKELHFKLVKQDEWLTPEYAVKPLVRYLKPGSRILCPFDEVDSAYVTVLRSEGFRVSHTHIDDGSPLADFFDFTDAQLNSFDYVVSNPPYSRKTEILTRLFEAKVPFAMLLGGVGLFESHRFDLFKKYKFELMYFDRRIGFRAGAGQRAAGSPPFSSIYVCHNVLPKQIVFQRLDKKWGCA